MNLELLWPWLKYDIDQETQKAAKCLITNDPSGEITMEAQTADDTFDIDFCKRKITEGCSLIQDVLHRYFSGLMIYEHQDLPLIKVGDKIKGGNISFTVVSVKDNTFVAKTATNKEYTFTYNSNRIDNGSSLVFTIESWPHGDKTQKVYVPIPLTSSDKLLHSAVRWAISLGKFGDRHNVDATMLSVELHKYIVLYVLEEWSKLTHPTMETNYVSRLNAEENRIKSICNRKDAPSRPK